MALTISKQLLKWNKERNLIKTPEEFDLKTESSFVVEELLEARIDIESSKARKYAKFITWILFLIPGVKSSREMIVDAFADIIVFATGAIYKLGFDTDKVMKEVIKEINSRKGEVKNGKFEKFKDPESKANWYKADFSKCLLNS